VKYTGEVDSSAGYHHAFAALQGAGNYVRLVRYASFGLNATNIQLFDKNKQFIKSVPGTRIDLTDLISFVLAEDDANSAAYTVLNVDDRYPDVIGLFFDSENYNFIGNRPPNANFGAATNPLFKKKLVCDGDSICRGLYDRPYSNDGWFGRLKNDYSMSGVNYAVNGGTITDMTDTTLGGNPRHSVVVSIDTLIAENPQLDYLILEGGTNDADLIGRFVDGTAPAKFGSWAEGDYTGNYDIATFCGAVEKTFYKALNQWPKAKIGFIIPMQMGISNNASANRRRYFDEIVSIAKKWHIPVLDLWNESQMDARLTVYYDSTLTSAQNVSAGKCYYDGQHPTSYGYDLMQAKIENWVKSM
jgi:lysophospholipase L1-like esterase